MLTNQLAKDLNLYEELSDQAIEQLTGGQFSRDQGEFSEFGDGVDEDSFGLGGRSQFPGVSRIRRRPIRLTCFLLPRANFG